MTEPRKRSWFAPDQEHDWECLGPATAARWPHGIPGLIATSEGQWFYEEYAGYVWRFKCGAEDEKAT